MDGKSRKSEILDLCLELFIKNGLYNTSMRDLSVALNMRPSGIYYHFPNKDTIVLACAEEAILRLEKVLILPFIESFEDVELYIEKISNQIELMSPLMQFFAQVYTCQQYKDEMKIIIEKLKERHFEYAKSYANKLNCETEDIAPYLYACVATVSNYMIFGEELYFSEPLKIMRKNINDLIKMRR